MRRNTMARQDTKTSRHSERSKACGRRMTGHDDFDCDRLAWSPPSEQSHETVDGRRIISY